MTEKPMVVRPIGEVVKSHPEFKPGWGWDSAKHSFLNPRFGEIRHVVVCKPDGTPIYDQPADIEPVGAITIPVTKEGKIRLIRQFRPVVLPEGIEPKFPESSSEASWGRWFLDVPRGFPMCGEIPKEVAIRETGEEGQSPVLRIRFLSEVNANATYFVHMIPVFVAEIDEDFKGKMPQDINEKILKGEDYSVYQVKRLIEDRQIQDALTLSALNLYFVHVMLV